MLYFELVNGEVVTISTNPDINAICANRLWAREGGANGWLNRNDIPSFEYATQLAESATKATGRRYIAIDSGAHVSPRYDVIAAPAVGDECSQAFNGDYYPVGKIVAITKDTMRVVTVEGPRGGLRFYRQGQSGRWTNNKYWALVPGVHSELNPHF